MKSSNLRLFRGQVFERPCRFSTKISIDSFDSKVSIYGWQNYLIWKILAFHGHCNNDLIDYAKKVISDDSATAAGAMLYLGKCGKLTDKVKIAECFKGMDNFFHQRHALLGVQEIDYKIVKDYINPYVLKESFGIFHALKNMNEPHYILPPEPVSYKELINEVSFYV